MTLAMLGLLLLPLVAAVVLFTGIPSYIALLLAAVAGAAAGLATGAVSVDLLGALPGRLINLLESDLLQALPLYLLMGILLDRIGIADALFATFCRLTGDRASSPLVAGIGIGALIGPMNGSVGASVLALTRTLGPRLEKAGVGGPAREAIVAVAGTLGVVVPPSLVLILLGDALLTAHTIARNATGRLDRIVNTQDLMRGALPAAGLFVVAAIAVAMIVGQRAKPIPAARDAASRGTILTACVAIAAIVVLLGGVTAGKFYAVEAAATGAMMLFAWAAVSGRLGRGELGGILSETLQTTGVLFAPLLAATTFTLVLRLLGSDKLVESFIAGLPGGSVTVLATALAVIAVSAIALDAFEIIFVVVPILAPPVLMRVPDAVWVGVTILMALQASFLLPPFGAALMLARSSLKTGAKLSATIGAMAPFLATQMLVLLLLLSMPSLVHLLDKATPATETPAEAGTEAAERRLRDMMGGQAIPGLPGLPGLPPVAKP